MQGNTVLKVVVAWILPIKGKQTTPGLRISMLVLEVARVEMLWNTTEQKILRQYKR